MPPLFVYGTLLFPEILDALLSRVPHYLDATLPAYRRFSIHDGPYVRPYPAILPEPKALVKGILLLELSKEEGQILDAYEGEDYTKTTCVVTCGSELVDAHVYVWRADQRGQLRGNWDPGNFQSNYLNAYLSHFS